jgi:hypothetical protein
MHNLKNCYDGFSLIYFNFLACWSWLLLFVSLRVTWKRAGKVGVSLIFIYSILYLFSKIKKYIQRLTVYEGKKITIVMIVDHCDFRGQKKRRKE